MAAGTFRPALLASAAARARARRVVDFRYALKPELVAGYDLPGLTTFTDADGSIKYQPHNFFTHRAGTVAQLGYSQNVADAAWDDASYPAAIQFGNNSATRAAYKFFTTVSGVAYAVSVRVVMDDGLAPVPSSTAESGDFSLVLETNLMPTPSVELQADGSYLVTASMTAAAIQTLHGVIKYTSHSARGFRATDFQLRALPSPAASIDTTTAARHLPALFDNGRRGLRLEGPGVNRASSYPTPTDTAALLLIGDPACTKSLVNKSSEVAAAGLANLSPSGTVYKIDNSAGTSTAYGYFSGSPANLSAHNYSAWLMGAGWLTDAWSGSATAAIPSATSFVRVSAAITPLNAVSANLAVRVPAGQIAHVLLPQLTEGSALQSYVPNPTAGMMLRPGAQQVISGAEFNRLFPAARVRGPELVANGGFDSPSGWLLSNAATDMEISGGALRSLVSASKWAHSDASNLTAGTRYVATWEHLTAGDVPAAATRVIAGHPGINFCDSNYTTGLGAKSLLFAAPVSGKFGLFTFSAGLNIDNVSVRELDTSVPSLQAFTLFITLADRPRAFVNDFVIFAINNAAGAFGAGHGLFLRAYASGAVEASGQSSSALKTNVLVDGKNIIGLSVDVASKRMSLTVNGSTLATTTTLDYTGVASALARHRGLDSAATQGGGAVIHESLEVLPLMSDAAAQAECARRFALP